MGLLITLHLIIQNTYSNLLNNSPPIKGFGYVGFWMIGCQGMIFIALLEYGILLHLDKFGSLVRVFASNKVSHRNEKLKKVDRIFLRLAPIIFLFFNFVYWSSLVVSHPKSR